MLTRRPLLHRSLPLRIRLLSLGSVGGTPSRVAVSDLHQLLEGVPFRCSHRRTMWTFTRSTGRAERSARSPGISVATARPSGPTWPVAASLASGPAAPPGAMARVSGWRRGPRASRRGPALVSGRLGGLKKSWRFNRMATVASANTGRVTASFATVAKHYGVQVTLWPPRHGNRKGTRGEGQRHRRTALVAVSLTTSPSPGPKPRWMPSAPARAMGACCPRHLSAYDLTCRPGYDLTCR